MIQAFNLSKSYDGVYLFKEMSFSLSKGEIVGLVGRNGSGKSTMLKIIAGLENYDSGSIGKPNGYKLGYLDQHIHFTKPTLLEECCQVLSEEEQYDYYKAEIILFGLGFTKADLEKDPSVFSGGFQLRINLTKTLLQNPDLLLLDEPTNYLDILSLRWLRLFLKNFRGESIIITHDRSFMDSVTSHTMGIHRKKLVKIKGSTGKYYEKIVVDEEIYESTRLNQELKIKDMQKFVDRFGAKASKASQAKSKQKQIDKIEVLDKLTTQYRPGFRFQYDKTPSKVATEVSDLSFSYTGKEEDNLFKDLSFRVESNDRICIIGKNGKGKTTLLNVLSGISKQLTGTVKNNPNTTLGYYRQTNRKDLHGSNTVYQEIHSANQELSISAARSICGAMMFPGDDADKKISVLSGGEQSRVLFGQVIAKPANLLFLDEPSNHLDMESIEVMIEEIDKFKGAVVLVTHNEEMLRKLANKLVIFHEGHTDLFLGTYNEFLDKVGWEEESDKSSTVDNKSDSSPSKPESASKKVYSSNKKLNRIIRMLKRNQEKLEKEMETLEQDLETKKTQALELVQGDPTNPEVKVLYSLVEDMENQIDPLYKKMEANQKELDSYL